MRRPLVIGSLLVCATLSYAAIRYARRGGRETRDTADAAACPEARALGAACGACVAGSCCGEVSACYGWADCIDLNDCWVRCGDEDEAPKVSRAACPGACENKYPAAVAAFHAWDDCVRGRCGEVCPRGPDEEEREKRSR